MSGDKTRIVVGDLVILKEVLTVKALVTIDRVTADNVPNALMSGAQAGQRARNEVISKHPEADYVLLIGHRAQGVKKGQDPILELTFEVTTTTKCPTQ